MTGWSGSSLVTALTLNLILSGGPLDMFAVSRSVPSDQTKLEQTNSNQKKKGKAKRCVENGGGNILSAARRANAEAPYSQSDAIATVSRGKPLPCCAWLPAPTS